jgi:hypothetical protein
MYVARNIEARSWIIAAVEKQDVLLILCVRACMWVPVRVGVCIRVRAYSTANPTCNAYAPYCDVNCGPSVSYIFFDIIS